MTSLKKTTEQYNGTSSPNTKFHFFFYIYILLFYMQMLKSQNIIIKFISIIYQTEKRLA